MRNKLKKLLREGLIVESMNVYIENFQYDDELETVGDISYFTVRKIYGDFFKNGNYPDEIRNKINADSISPDGGDYFNNTGIMNFYVGDLDVEVIKKILSYIYYILPEYGIELGEVKWEKHTNGESKSGYRVIRIPIIENNWDGSDTPPDINLSNLNSIFIFKDVLGYDVEDYTFPDIHIPELLSNIRKAKVNVKSMNLKGGTEKHGNIYVNLPDEEYVIQTLGRIEDLALWARERGYTKLYVA
jgi:hypothetical protein